MPTAVPEDRLPTPMAAFLKELHRLMVTHQVVTLPPHVEGATAPPVNCIQLACSGVCYDLEVGAPGRAPFTVVHVHPVPATREDLRVVCYTRNWPALEAACRKVAAAHSHDLRFQRFVAEGYRLAGSASEWILPVNPGEYGDLLAEMALRGLEYTVVAPPRTRAKREEMRDTDETAGP